MSFNKGLNFLLWSLQDVLYIPGCLMDSGKKDYILNFFLLVLLYKYMNHIDRLQFYLAILLDVHDF